MRNRKPNTTLQTLFACALAFVIGAGMVYLFSEGLERQDLYMKYTSQ